MENAELRAFITITAKEALAEAARAEKEIANGRYRGALHGIPVSVKDLVDVAGTPTTSGSNVAPWMAKTSPWLPSRIWHSIDRVNGTPGAVMSSEWMKSPALPPGFNCFHSSSSTKF